MGVEDLSWRKVWRRTLQKTLVGLTFAVHSNSTWTFRVWGKEKVWRRTWWRRISFGGRGGLTCLLLASANYVRAMLHRDDEERSAATHRFWECLSCVRSLALRHSWIV